MNKVSNSQGHKHRCISVGADELKAFLLEMRRRNYSPKTLHIFDRAVGAFLSCLAASGVQRLQDIEAEHIENYRRNLMDKNLAEQTVDICLRSIRQFFRHLEATQRIFADPTDGLVLPKVHRHLQPVPTVGEMNKLLAQPDMTKSSGVRDRAILEVAYSTGVRLGELHKMKVGDPDYDHGIIRVSGKGRKERILPLGKQALLWLKQYVREQRPKLLDGKNDETALWISREGGQLSTMRLQQIAKHYARAAGIRTPINIHAIRRACATHMLQNDAHPVQLQMLLGHSSLRTLSQYLRVTIRDMQKTHRKTRVGK